MKWHESDEGVNQRQHQSTKSRADDVKAALERK